LSLASISRWLVDAGALLVTRRGGAVWARRL